MHGEWRYGEYMEMESGNGDQGMENMGICEVTITIEVDY